MNSLSNNQSASTWTPKDHIELSGIIKHHHEDLNALNPFMGVTDEQDPYLSYVDDEGEILLLVGRIGADKVFLTGCLIEEDMEAKTLGELNDLMQSLN